MNRILPWCLALGVALAAPVAAAEDTWVLPASDDEGKYPCVVVDWNHLTVSVVDRCWDPPLP